MCKGLTLNDYLKQIKLKKCKFSEKTGIGITTVSKVCNGYKVKPTLAKAIEFFTEGKVKAQDICTKPMKQEDSSFPPEQFKFKF